MRIARAASLGGLGTALLIGSLCLASPSDGNVYKWKDVQGRIHYTDRPPPPDGQLIAVERPWGVSHKPGESPPAPAATRPPAASGVSPDGLSPAQQAALKNSVQNDVAATRSEQCKAAQERYQNYVRSRRLFKEGPNKERVYLSDAELEEARVNAKREADEACAAASAGR